MSERDDGCRCYQRIDFTEERAATIARIRGLVEHYAAQSMSVTVRQVYYQFVARGWAPSGDATYNKIQGALRDGRLAGLVPWTYVEDRGRSLRGTTTWSSPAALIKSAAAQYATDLWAGQKYRPEVWVEKVALEGVVGDICSELRVDYYATRGYDSQSQQWRAGQRMAKYIQQGQHPVVLHLADHDPSGIDMTRDVEQRLSMFAGTRVQVVRIALNMEQIEKFSPPPFDVKMTDSRGAAYRGRFGEDAWELDALDPSDLKHVIDSAVAMLRDEKEWSAALAQEVDDRRELEEMMRTLSGDEDEDDDYEE